MKVFRLIGITKALLPVIIIAVFGLLMVTIHCTTANAVENDNHHYNDKNDLNGDNMTEIKSDDASYNALWEEVQRFQNEGLPQSVLKVVDKIYAQAKKENNAGQLIKALIHKMRFLQEVEEDTLVKVQKKLNDELKGSSFPVTPMLHSLLAEQYWNYYNQQRFRILSRTETSKDFKEDDIRTWDAKRIVEAVLLHYDKSLEHSEKSKKIKIGIYDAVLIKDMEGRHFRPTLFDFLAHRAVDFLMDSEAGLTRPAYQFTLNDEAFWGDTDSFVKMKLETKDQFSFDFRAMTYLQELAKFHLEDDSPDALVDVELKRFGYMYRDSSISNKDQIYENALRQMMAKFKDRPITAEIYYELAKLYDKQGNNYRPHLSDDYKMLRKKAYDLCKEAIQKYPGSIGADNCQSLIDSILGKELHLSKENAELPQKPSRILARYRNINRIYLKVIRTDRDEIQNSGRTRKDDMIAAFLAKNAVKSWEVSLPDDDDYQPHATEIKCDGLDAGSYILIAGTHPDFDIKNHMVAYYFFNVSRIAYIQRQYANNQIEFYLLHRETGQPLTDGAIQLWSWIYNKAKRGYQLEKGQSIPADKNGYVVITKDHIKQNYFFVEFIDGDDHLFLMRNVSLYDSHSSRSSHNRTIFFTDRSIYRPGQTVYLKGIMLNIDEENPAENKILPDNATQVTLYDVNGKEVASLNLKSNEYGTFSGSFQLPVGRLNGSMRIDNHTGSVYFSVEEYKRPQFNVTFLPLEKSYRINDHVTVKGIAKAYAGYNIDGAEVKYRVLRRAFFPCPWYYRYRYGAIMPPASPEMEITNGVTQTQADGTFEIQFKAIPDLDLNPDLRPAFNYIVSADITDINGETRSGSQSVSIGYTALKLDITLPEKLDKNQKEWRVPINSTTLGGDFISAKGNIEIFSLEPPAPGHIFRERQWQRPDKHVMTQKDYYALFPRDEYANETDILHWKQSKKVFTTDFDTEKSKTVLINKLNNWKEGQYIARMTSKDRFGNDIEQIAYFTLYSSTGRVLPFTTPDWFTVVKGTAEPGEKALFLIGTSESRVRVLFETEHRGEIIDRQFLDIKGGQQKIAVPIDEEFRGNLGVHFTFIHENRQYMHTETIIVPWSNKKLNIAFETFRDKLQPGEAEEWRIKLKGPKGEKVAAEMVAALYDASLDAFRSHGWSFDIFSSRYAQRQWMRNPFFNPVESQFLGKPRRYRQTEEKSYDHINWFGFHWRLFDRVTSFGVRRRLKPGAIPPPAAVDPAVAESAPDAMDKPRGVIGGMAQKADAANEMGFDEGVEGSVEIDDVTASSSQQGEIKVRTNFNETAFFFPHLKTTPEGEIVIAFTIPEALTQWKMLGFAHTKNLEYGLITNQLVTQKDLMIIPNAPRFLREGDTLIFIAKVTNLSEKELNGIARLQLFDAVTMQPLNKKGTGQGQHSGLILGDSPFLVKKGQSGLVSWKFKIPDTLDALTYRITAEAGKFTDGEEKTLPVLTNRMMVTESMPLPVRALQTKFFKMDKLIQLAQSDTLKHHKVTLEFTSNPVWYAVQALPYLMEYPHDCMEQTFSRFYANSLASYIVHSDPKIKRAFDLWKEAIDTTCSPNANALLSNLEKNQELKSTLLQETPWVLSGQDETQRKRRIALLFDLNHMTSQLDSALKKLAEGQMPSGGWSWFKGMHESRYITQHIVCGFAHLGVLKAKDIHNDKTIWKMMKAAVPYLDREINDDYRQLIQYKVNLKENHLNYGHIHYLYARSYFQDIPIHADEQEAFEYFRGQAKKYWLDFKGNKYIQGMIALIMKRYGYDDVAVAIAKSIKEHALYSEEMGMYWKNDTGFYWYQLPIESHALLIEMFDEVLKDEKSVDELKTWLLKQKQTQDWGTTKATAEACYALLLKGDQWLKESQAPEITIGKQQPMTIIPGSPTNKNLHDTDIQKVEAGTGYFKTAWTGKEIQPDMGYITVKNNNKIVAWGSLYWQYFEQLDKITPAKTPLHLEKKLFVEKPSDTGPVIHPIDKSTNLKVGDRIKVRITLRVDRDMEYVHMKDMRASTMEPEQVISTYRWQDGVGYYQSTKDASTNFFFDYLPKGTFVFEYPLRITHEGDFSNGITSIQSMYAPEFTSHSEGVRVQVGNKQ